MGNTISILVVDDENTVRSITERLLTKKGYHVVSAENYDKAVLCFEKERFNILITDHLMPGKTGLDLIMQIKNISPDTVCVLMTGVGDRNLYRDVINRASVFSVIEKPYDSDTLFTVIGKAADVYGKRVEEIAETQKLKDQYHTIFDNTTDLIQCTDLTGRIIYVNSMWHHVLGYDSEEIKSLYTFSFIKDNYKDLFSKLIKRLGRGEKIKTFETVMVSKNGMDVFLEGNAIGQIQDGKVFAIIFIFRDVTEKKKNAEELNARLKQEMMVAKIAYLLARAEEPFAAFNDIVQIIGTSTEVDIACLFVIDNNKEEYKKIALWQSENKKDYGYIPETVQFSSIPNFHKKILNNEIYSFPAMEMIPYPEKEIGEKTDTNSFIITPINVGHSNVGVLFIASHTKKESWTENEKAMLTAAVDIIANSWKRQMEIDIRKEKEDEAEQSRMLVIRADRLAALGTMTAGIIHEITQPLNAISVSAQTILYGLSKGWEIDIEQIKKSMSFIVEQIKRMQQIIVNMRAFARDGHTLPREMGNLNEIVNQILTLVSEQIRAHGVQLDLELGDIPEIFINKQQISQVVMNLLTNAREAVDDAKTSNKNIQVKTYFSDGNVVIEVADNATGVPIELKDKIFDPFFTTKEVGKGTGLGLAICTRIVDDHGGTLDVFSNEMNGATFIMTLPVKNASVEENR